MLLQLLPVNVLGYRAVDLSEAEASPVENTLADSGEDLEYQDSAYQGETEASKQGILKMSNRSRASNARFSQKELLCLHRLRSLSLMNTMGLLRNCWPHTGRKRIPHTLIKILMRTLNLHSSRDTC